MVLVSPFRRSRSGSTERFRTLSQVTQLVKWQSLDSNAVWLEGPCSCRCTMTPVSPEKARLLGGHKSGEVSMKSQLRGYR